MTPEGKVKKVIKSLLDLKKPEMYYNMPVPSGYGRSMLDFVGCYYGWFFAIEAKAPGEEPTERQNGTIEDMQAAGAAVFVLDGSAPGLAALEAWLVAIERVSV